MSNFIDLVKKRTSIRKYDTHREIEQEKLDLVLEAARLAPSARNLQNWKFIVADNKHIQKEIIEACNNQSFVGFAPKCIVVCANNDRMMACNQSTASVDCSIAMTHIVLQAAELDLGTCWLGSFHADKISTLLEIPEDYVVVAVTPIGYAEPDYTFERRPRKPIDEVVLYK